MSGFYVEMSENDPESKNAFKKIYKLILPLRVALFFSGRRE